MEDVFKREVGELTVHAGPAGEYWIKTGVVMDTHDWHIPFENWQNMQF